MLATSIVSAQGDEDRCSDIYPVMYRTMVPHFKQVVSLWDQDQKKVKDEVTNEVARTIVKRTVQMLLNIMGMRARPIHPIAFFSVIKDFESSLEGATEDSEEAWSGGASAPTTFQYSTGNCTTRCLGLFQVDLGVEQIPAYLEENPDVPSGYSGESRWLTTSKYGVQVSQSFEEICAKGGVSSKGGTSTSGLGLLGMKGGLDTCAALYWWLIPNSPKHKGKCAQLPEAPPAPEGYIDDINPCTDTTNAQGVYPWSPTTFAYAHKYAYVQANQLDDYNKDDPWRALYVGGTAPKGVKYFMGYEHCAARFFLNRILLQYYSPKGQMAVGSLPHWFQYDAHNVIGLTEPFQAGSPEHLDTDEGRELMRFAVADFAADIGLMPWWYAQWNKSKEKTQQPPSPPVSQHKGKAARRR